MQSLSEVSLALRHRLRDMGGSQHELLARAGVSHATLSHVLNGNRDFKVSTLLAVADRLGLELLLVPKDAAGVVGQGTTLQFIPSVVDRALGNSKLKAVP